MTARVDIERLRAQAAQIKPGRIEYAWVNDDEALAQMNFGDDLREMLPAILAELERAQRMEVALQDSSAHFAELWNAYCIFVSNGGGSLIRHAEPLLKECHKWQVQAVAALAQPDEKERSDEPR